MALVGEIAHHPSGHPTAVAPVPATSPGPVQSDPAAFRRIACQPILPAAAVPAFVCHFAGSIDFAPADSVVAATDSAWTAVVVFDSVAIAGSADSAGFVAAVAVVAGSVV